MIMKEHILLQNLKEHPNILKSYCVNLEGILEKEGNCEKDTIMYNVLEFAEHGSLAFFIRTTGHFEEEIARFHFKQMVHATEFIHWQNYAHLDLKLENILLDKYFNVKVADLGAAVYVGKSEGKTHYRRGTILYMAPEVIGLKSGEIFDAYAADIYSLGVWLHVMLVGEFPNPDIHSSMAATTDSDSQGIDESEEWTMEELVKKRWDLLSDSVKTLILKMISKDPEERPNIKEVLETEWLQEPFSELTPYHIYSEMGSRKEFIISTWQKPSKNSN